MRTLNRGPEKRLRSDSVNWLQGHLTSLRSGLWSDPWRDRATLGYGTRNESLLSRTSGPGPRVVRSRPLPVNRNAAALALPGGHTG